ncbi:hypothetical protein [Ammoniphilus sp. CFH 90114]|uniref:hypothetical protein n=1 Tax=Ammoniphilus sp. CFH 90114 TaxID=2493665 RepID=UPI00100E5C63|nr:hypothetical protein [Ammoniphilus sp. CFH 90114]RXT14953.1 hypothetical protein EIZ39_01725 [Ammoniphilus sp. CFH 90114]
MIKSFLKKVFSSSSETPAEVQASPSENHIQTEPIHPPHESVADSLMEIRFEEVILKKEWMEKHLTKEWNSLINRIYEEAMQDPKSEPKRIRLRLEEDLLEQMDTITARRIGKYIHLCEQEVIEFTFFLDKQHKPTMEIYKTYVLPQRVNELNGFLQERCLMIYETSEAMSKDYREEIESYFASLDIPMGEDFFAQFDQWRQEVLKKHEEEERRHTENSQEARQASVMIKISKEEVENENIHQLDHYLAKALQTPESARAYQGTLLFSFYGYAKNGELLDLMNRKDVKEWASLLVEKHPYIFYFLNNEEYPMTRFLTSLVVTTEVEDDSVYYNEEELEDFRAYVGDALSKLATWLDEEEDPVHHTFDCHFR